MLSINDYNHLKLLYEQFVNLNAQIKNSIQKEDSESVQNAIKEKDILIRRIMQVERANAQDIKENKELFDLRKKIVELEKENLELAIEFKSKLTKELNKLSKARKILNTYEPISNKEITTIDIKTED